MKKIVSFLLFFVVCFSAQAQGKYEKQVKSLSQTGLPLYYTADLEANIEAWISNEENITSDILGKFRAYEEDLEYITKSYGLPWFIKYIPAANTGLNVQFQSKLDGSKGIWPLDYQIAKKYNLNSNSFEDERLSFVESSEAACQYLKVLFGIYKDWQKAILAFRIGPVRVNQLIRENNTVHFNDFYKKLTAYEKEPINQFYAAMTVLYFADTFGIKSSPFNRIAVDTASCELPVTFNIIEKFTGIPQQTLIDLNPSLLRNAVPAVKGTNYFNLPLSTKGIDQENRDTIHTYTKYTLYPPMIFDTLVKIVDSIEYLEIVKRPFGDFAPGRRTIVSIQNTQKPRIESEIPRKEIPVKSNDPKDIQAAKDNSKETSNINDTLVQRVPQPIKLVWVKYEIKKKDGLYTLSDIFDCNMTQIKKWNNMTGNGIFIGQKMQFMVPENKLSYYQKINSMTPEEKVALAKNN